ncbi:acetoin dehydrogenase-like protein [Rhizodiscina lignyota]|uniref:Acetoin dehydrogenase-like protein n=1 Tax=Rhizodiscina lignyota TaxID=1504668 RepID=A0A9P4IPB9_9PEZI|nr:acetoin dehydrogenase-like protein [Rhizodiscina lignyota]
MASRTLINTAFRRRAAPSVARAPITRFPKHVRTAFSTPEQKRRTAIITGSGRGIGKAIAIRLAQDGWDLCLNDIPSNKGDVESVVNEVQSTYNRKAISYLADVSDLKHVEAMVEESAGSLGPLNLMVANAGIAQVKGLLDLSEKDFRRMFEVNVFGVYNCYRAAAAKMIEQGDGGKILGCASIVAFKPFALLSHYSASKWAVRGLTQAMAMEMAKHKITVNAYAPGIVGTKMWDLIDEELGNMVGAKKGDTIAKYSGELIALGRTSVPEDVSKVVSFLAGPDSDYMTGQTVVVDGGIIFT